MWLAPELKSDFAKHVDQAQFQQVVEGGRLATAKKYAVETTDFDPFDLPGLTGANENLDFHDAGESISRRRIDFYFTNPVTQVDPEMPEKLKKELGNIIHICNEAYLEKCRTVKSRVWNVLPQYFIELRQENAAATNALEHFLQRANLEYHPDYCITLKEFQSLYGNHCKDFNLDNRKTLKRDYCQGPFVKRQLHQKEGTIVIDNKRRTCILVYGVRQMTEDPLP